MHLNQHHQNLINSHAHPARPASSTSPNSSAAASFILPNTTRLSSRSFRNEETNEIENAKTRAKVTFIKSMLELQKQRKKARIERKIKRANMMAKRLLEKEAAGEANMDLLMGSPSATSTAECVEAFVGSPYPGESRANQAGQGAGNGPSSGDEIPTSPAMKTSHL